METSLIVNTTDTSNKKIQKTITYANPNATNANLKLFAQKMTGLTTNTFEGANRVNKQDVDEPDGGGSSKLTPTFTAVFDRRALTGSYTYNGDGEVFGYAETSVFSEVIPELLLIDHQNKILGFSEDVDIIGSDVTLKLYASEGENYAAASCIASIVEDTE